jgi:hypothetical protein
MNTSISHFLQEQSCANICVVDAAGKPYCFSCFYAFDLHDGLLSFKSSSDTYHVRLMRNNPNVAGTVLPDKLNKLLIQGIQFEGYVLPGHHPMAIQGHHWYIKKHPMSLAIPGEVWTIQLNLVKFTDSTKVFGKKTNWNRSEHLV